MATTITDNPVGSVVYYTGPEDEYGEGLLTDERVVIVIDDYEEDGTYGVVAEDIPEEVVYVEADALSVEPSISYTGPDFNFGDSVEVFTIGGGWLPATVVATIYQDDDLVAEVFGAWSYEVVSPALTWPDAASINVPGAGTFVTGFIRSPRA